MIEEYILHNSGHIAQAGIGSSVVLWCVLKIRHHCNAIAKLKERKVDKETYEIKHTNLVDLLKDNKEEHHEIFTEIKEIKNLIIQEISKKN